MINKTSSFCDKNKQVVCFTAGKHDLLQLKLVSGHTGLIMMMPITHSFDMARLLIRLTAGEPPH
jgi:hypothetical protein